MIEDDQPVTATKACTANEEDPGVPGFRTWRGVYVFVFSLFVAIVIALAIFTRYFA